MTDFTLLYSDLILKDLFRKISTRTKAKIKSEKTRSENAIHSVSTQRHWQAAAKSELHYKVIDLAYNRMKDLDELTNWSGKLNQNRFKFIDKYPDIMKRYEDFYKEGKNERD